MNILALDTSSTSGSIALSKNDRIVYVSYLDIRKTHSERLMVQVKEALEQNKMNIDDLDLICLANGPGSFTGIRIGLATAKGLSYGKQIPLLALNNLELIASNIYGNQRPILSFVDAKMGEVYTALYSAELEELISPRNCKPAEMLELIDQPVTVIGTGVNVFKQNLDESGIDYLEVLPHQSINLATACISLATRLEDYPTYNFEAIAELEPFYLRKSQAEINKEKGE